MNDSFYDGYLSFLENKVEFFTDSGTHNRLFEKLHSIPYTPHLPDDENREQDGIDLRDEYYSENDGLFIDTPCSFLEFLIALSIRSGFIYSPVSTDYTRELFWRYLENLGLRSLTDDAYLPNGDEIVEKAVNMVVNRTYAPSGLGNIFPLDNPQQDQRNVEVWYQMNQYLRELMVAEGRI